MTSLQQLRDAGALAALDEHCARTLCRLAGDERPAVLLATALAARQVSLGHVCVDLAALCERPLLLGENGEPLPGVALPELDTWLGVLRASPLVDAAAGGAQRRPLVLDAAGRLYLRRYFEHEQSLALAFRARAGAGTSTPDDAQLEEALDRLFPASVARAPGSPDHTPRATRSSRDATRQLALEFPAPRPRADAKDDAPDMQRVAARTAATRRLCVISGGPGTGKTSTVVKILALLAEQRRRDGGAAPRMVLVAPTGKAAMRLSEAIRRAKRTLACDAAIQAAIPEEASTIHRALRSIGGSSTRFRHDATHPLRADVVLVDEASMVDLALMARLVAAVPTDARLILLGDKDQLASVEAGAVLAELCDAGEARAAGDPLAASIVELTRSYRYRPGSGIEALARAINAGDAAGALAVLDDATHPDVRRVEPAADETLGPELRASALASCGAYLDAPDGASRLRALERTRILCAHRHGPHGVAAVNAAIEAMLVDERRIDRRAGLAYDGRPIMVTRNDYQLQLFNGDVGTIVEHDGKRLAYFLAPDGSPRLLSPARLPPHETVFAMTVHKSQGSEFDHVAVLLGERSSPLLTRELLYTAVTRARETVTIHATRDVLADAIARRTERGSGLSEALWGWP
jgi:exodeoxyribonuclease V alpha subunit